MKNLFVFSFFLITTITLSQSAKEKRFKQDVARLVEEMESMYTIDKLLLEYSSVISYNRSDTVRIDNLSERLGIVETANKKIINDSLTDYIFKNHINPKYGEHSARMIAIIKKYGFPGNERIRLYYDKEFRDPKFMPYRLLENAPLEHSIKLKKLLRKELKKGRINKCTYGNLMWRLSRPMDTQILLDNGYVMEEKDGVPHFKPDCE